MITTIIILIITRIIIITISLSSSYLASMFIQPVYFWSFLMLECSCDAYFLVFLVLEQHRIRKMLCV